MHVRWLKRSSYPENAIGDAVFEGATCSGSMSRPRSRARSRTNQVAINQITGVLDDICRAIVVDLPVGTMHRWADLHTVEVCLVSPKPVTAVTTEKAIPSRSSPRLRTLVTSTGDDFVTLDDGKVLIVEGVPEAIRFLNRCISNVFKPGVAERRQHGMPTVLSRASGEALTDIVDRPMLKPFRESAQWEKLFSTVAIRTFRCFRSIADPATRICKPAPPYSCRLLGT